MYSLVPRPHPFLKGNIGPGKVSAVCVFTLGRTKKCAANQITVLKHVKLTCDGCSLRRVSTECRVVHGAMQVRDVCRVCDEPATAKFRRALFSGSLAERFNSLVVSSIATCKSLQCINYFY